MAFVPAPGAARIVVQQTQNALPYSNVFAAATVEGVGPAVLSALAETVLSVWAANIMPQLSTSCSLLNVTAYAMDSESAPVSVAVPPTPVTGQRLGDPAPLSSAVVITTRTGGRGRSARGRFYIAGFSEVDTVGRAVEPAVVNAVEAGIEALRVALAARTNPLIVLSLYSGGNPRTRGALFQVTSVEARSTIIGTQRRRLRRP